MCQKCLYLDELEDIFRTVYVGNRMSNPHKAKPYDRQWNLAKIRFGEFDAVTGWKKRPRYNKKDERIEFEEGKDYTARELEQLADQMLRDDARAVDPDTGKERGIGGENPILFDEHIYQRQKREILNENGVPEPGLVRGMYDRSHPEGRKVNSEEQRKRHGASYYRVVPWWLPGLSWHYTVLLLSVMLLFKMCERYARRRKEG